MSNFQAFAKKMTAAGLCKEAIRTFQHNYEILLSNEIGMIPEETISPVKTLPSWKDFSEKSNEDISLLSHTVVIKLNGGLGTGMGLQCPKSLLKVHDELNFLDLIVRQISALRKASGSNIRLLWMNSWNTSAKTLEHLSKYRSEGFADISEVELMQHYVPKIDALSMEPVEWSKDLTLEWCPPGHGNLYSALTSSGWINRLLDQGIIYAFVSNADNLGAILDTGILRYFSDSGAPFMMEVTSRTPTDRKGGHLAVRQSNGRLLLREIAQCPQDDLASFQEIQRYRYFNTNNIWIRLDLLVEKLRKSHGILQLPIIINHKTVDPRDPSSPKVIQLETAMGAAVESFHDSLAIEVPRSRFAPVKTTADLFALRSDLYEVLENSQIHLASERKGIPPEITLSDDYQMVEKLEMLGNPSLIDCQSLSIKGSIHFDPEVRLRGNIIIENSKKVTHHVRRGVYENQTLQF